MIAFGAEDQTGLISRTKSKCKAGNAKLSPWGGAALASESRNSCRCTAGRLSGRGLSGQKLFEAFRRSQQNGDAYNLILCDAQVFKPVDTGQLLNHLKSQALVR
jgi:hypothetical protein